METCTSHNEAETESVARDFTARLRPGMMVTLQGDLGAGKSVFARAVIRTLAGDAALEVPSPTFTLVQTYETPHGVVWHFDLYRLKAAEEIYELGWDDALADGIVLVEWPERLGALTPPVDFTVTFYNVPDQPTRRHITLQSRTA